MNDDKIEELKQNILKENSLDDIDIKNILNPEEAKITATLDEQILEEEYFIQQYSHSKPLLNNKLEFFSSKEERMQLSKPHLADMANKKSMQKRMRFIILADIVLFIVILGVIYPSLRNLQTNGKLNGYRFSLKQSLDQKAAILNVVAKIERLAQSWQQTQQKQYEQEKFQIEIKYRGQLLLQEERPMPKIDSPVSYALFLVPYQKLLESNKSKPKPSNDGLGLDIRIQAGGKEKQFFLQLPQIIQITHTAEISQAE